MTEGCPIPFAARAVLQHSSPPCGGFWTYDDPNLFVFVSFTQDMDTGATPPTSLIKIDVDDVQKDEISFTWRTHHMFRAIYSEGALGPVDVDIKTLTTHPHFRTALGALVFPFDIQCIEWTPTAKWEYTDPDLGINITFPVPMDQTVMPIAGDFAIYVNGVKKDVIYLNWMNPTQLLVAASGTGFGIGPYDIDYHTATNQLRSLSQIVAPPFRLNDLPEQ